MHQLFHFLFEPILNNCDKKINSFFHVYMYTIYHDSISTPVSVTRTVYSHWAERLPSSV